MNGRRTFLRLGISMLALTSWLAAAAAQEVVTYTYDANGRLSSARYGGTTKESYTYDASGNVVRRVVSASAAGPFRPITQSFRDGAHAPRAHRPPPEGARTRDGNPAPGSAPLRVRLDPRLLALHGASLARDLGPLIAPRLALEWDPWILAARVPIVLCASSGLRESLALERGGAPPRALPGPAAG